MRLPAVNLRIAALTLLVTLAGCGDATGVRRELADARALWTSTEPARYEITMSRSCFCAPDAQRATIVHVEGNAVTSARYADTGEAVSATTLQYLPTVDDLFAEIEDASLRGTVSVSYDSAYGYPVSAQLDPMPQVADDEIAYFLKDFHPL